MPDPKKILVVQLKRAGDVIVTTPVLPALRARFPQATIHFLTQKPFASLLDSHPDVDRVQIYDSERMWSTLLSLRRERYDWIIDFQSSPRSVIAGLLAGAPLRAGYRVRFWGRFFNRSVKRPDGSISVVDGKFTLIEALIGPVRDRAQRVLHLSPAEQAWAQEVPPPESRSGAIVGVIPTHRRDTRRWHADQFVELGRKLRMEGHGVWLFWGPGEEDYVAAIEAQIPGSRRIPASSFRQMAALLARCALVVTNDNGPMHLAVAVGAPTVTFYGPTDPVAWNPGGSRHRVLQATGLHCLGCNLNTCPYNHECMTQITPATAWQACEELLRTTAVKSA